jgi:hypothetical protein
VPQLQPFGYAFGQQLSLVEAVFFAENLVLRDRHPLAHIVASAEPSQLGKLSAKQSANRSNSSSAARSSSFSHRRQPTGKYTLPIAGFGQPA